MVASGSRNAKRAAIENCDTHTNDINNDNTDRNDSGIPLQLPADFSYVISVKALRQADVSVPEKIHTCRKLLAHRNALTPHPVSLLLSHILHALEQRAAHFVDYRPEYWALLHDTLCVSPSHLQSELPSNVLLIAADHLSTVGMCGTANAKPNDVKSPSRSSSSTLKTTCTEAAPGAPLSSGNDGSTSTSEVVSPLTRAILTVLTTARLAPTLHHLVALLQQVAITFPYYPALRPVVLRLLSQLPALLSRVSTAEAFSTISKTLPPLLRDRTFWGHLAPLQRTLFFACESAGLRKALGSGTFPKVPDGLLVRFLFESCLRSAGNEAKQQQRGSSGDSSASLPLIFFRDLLAYVSRPIVNADSCDTTEDSLSAASCAVMELLDIAAREAIFRPQPADLNQQLDDDLKGNESDRAKKRQRVDESSLCSVENEDETQKGKVVREAGEIDGEEISVGIDNQKHLSGENPQRYGGKKKSKNAMDVNSTGKVHMDISKELSSLFSSLQKLTRTTMKDMKKTESECSSLDSYASAIAAILSFSIDSVDGLVRNMFVSIALPTRNAHVREAQEKIINAAMRAYESTRAVPVFCKHLASSALGSLGDALRAPRVARRFAATVADLPVGSAKMCVAAFAGLKTSSTTKEETHTKTVRCAAFLLSIVLEANTEVTKEGLVISAVNLIGPWLKASTITTSKREVGYFFLSSALFTLLRSRGGADFDVIEQVLSSELVSSLNTEAFRKRTGKKHQALEEFSELLIDVTQDERVNLNRAERFCISRLVCVVIRVFLQKTSATDTDKSQGFVCKLLGALFEVYEGLEQEDDSQDDGGYYNWVWQGPTAKGAMLSNMSSMCDVFEYGLGGKQTSSGFVKFLMDVMSRVEDDGGVWDELLEQECVRTVMSRAICKCLKQMRAEQTYDKNTSSLRQVLCIVRKLPYGYLSDEEESKVASAIEKACAKITCTYAIAEAAAAVIEKRPTQCDMAGVVNRAIHNTRWDGLLSILLAALQEREPSTDKRVDAVDAFLASCENNWDDLGKVAVLYKNCADVLVNGLASTDGIKLGSLPEEEGRVLCFVRRNWSTVLQRCVKCLQRSEEDHTAAGTRDITSALAIVGQVLQIFGFLDSHRLANDEEANTDTNDTKAVRALLEELIGSGLQECVRIVNRLGSDPAEPVEILLIARTFFECVTGGQRKPAYRAVLSEKGGAVLHAKLAAQALHWLNSRNTKHRTGGALILSGLASYETDRTVNALASTVADWMDESEKTGREKERELDVGVGHHRMVTHALAAGALMCGVRADANEPECVEVDATSGRVRGFDESALQRNLGKVRVGREGGGRVAAAAVRSVALELERRAMRRKGGGRGGSVESGGGSRGRANDEFCKEDEVWESALMAIGAGQVAVRRRGTRRLAQGRAQEVLTWTLRVHAAAGAWLWRGASGAGGGASGSGSGEELVANDEDGGATAVGLLGWESTAAASRVRERASRCIAAALDTQPAAWRWGVARIGGHMESAEVVEAVARSVDGGGSGQGGHGDVALVLLGDLCERLGSAEDPSATAGAEQQHVPPGGRWGSKAIGNAAARLVGAVGEHRARAVLAVASPVGAEALRHVHDVFVRRVQYRGE